MEKQVLNRRKDVELFEAIRREYQFGVGTVKGVARKFGVHRRMVRERAPDRAAFILLGAAVGTPAARLLAPESGARARRRLVRKGEGIFT